MDELYLLLRHIDDRLRSNPLPIGHVESAMSNLPVADPLDRRISACILGVPAA